MSSKKAAPQLASVLEYLERLLDEADVRLTKSGEEQLSELERVGHLDDLLAVFKLLPPDPKLTGLSVITRDNPKEGEITLMPWTSCSMGEPAADLSLLRMLR